MVKGQSSRRGLALCIFAKQGSRSDELRHCHFPVGPKMIQRGSRTRGLTLSISTILHKGAPLRRDNVRSLRRDIGPEVVVKFLCPVLLFAACSTQQYDVRRGGEPMSPASMLVRLHDVAFPLLVAAAEWCPLEQEPTYGFLLKDEAILQSGGGEGAGRKASVAYVHPRLSAASAGLRLGDQLISVNERTVSGIRAEEVSQWIRRMTVARIQPLQLEVARGESRQILNLWAVPACQFSVQLLETNQINGIADGRHVGVTTGAMRFVRSDDELAWILAHEIAHNVLSHSQSARLRAMLNAFLGATTGASPEASVPFERRSLEARADYVGAVIMARAGYDVQAIKQFWRRMESLRSKENTPEMDVSHPTTDERLASFEITLKEIQEKRDRGESLQPVLDNTQ